MPLTGDVSVRKAWIEKVIAAVQAGHFDGVTFDYESPMAWDDPARDYYVALVNETRRSMHASVPGSQVVEEETFSA